MNLCFSSYTSAANLYEHQSLEMEDHSPHAFASDGFDLLSFIMEGPQTQIRRSYEMEIYYLCLSVPAEEPTCPPMLQFSVLTNRHSLDTSPIMWAHNLRKSMQHVLQASVHYLHTVYNTHIFMFSPSLSNLKGMNMIIAALPQYKSLWFKRNITNTCRTSPKATTITYKYINSDWHKVNRGSCHPEDLDIKSTESLSSSRTPFNDCGFLSPITIRWIILALLVPLQVRY